MGLFGHTPTPQEQVREWRLKMKHEERTLDRQIRSIEREEAKVKASVKDAAKKGDHDVAKILCKELVRSRKAVNKLHASKAQLNSVVMSMQQQMSTAKIAGALSASTQVMQGMNALVRVPEVSATMQALSREMMKAGLIEEMLEDTMAMDDDDELEEEAEGEVNAILHEVTKGLLGQATVVTDALPSQAEPAAPEEDQVADAEVEDMMSRLETLRS